MPNPELKIDPEFQNLLDPRTPEEQKRLEEDIKVNGVREPLIGWKEEGILIDGHGRAIAATKYKKDYEVEWRSYPDREAALRAAVAPQLGRRNLSSARYTWYVGEKYLKAVKESKRKGGDVAKKLAKETGTSEATVRRAARKVQAAKAAEKAGDPEKAKRIKEGKEKVPAKKKSGTAKFDHKKYETALAVVTRGPDLLMEAYGVGANPHARACNRLMNEFVKAWVNLKKQLALASK